MLLYCCYDATVDLTHRTMHCTICSKKNQKKPSDKFKFQFVESSGIAGMLFIKRVLLSNHLAELIELMALQESCAKRKYCSAIAWQN